MVDTIWHLSWAIVFFPEQELKALLCGSNYICMLYNLCVIFKKRTQNNSSARLQLVATGLYFLESLNSSSANLQLEKELIRGVSGYYCWLCFKRTDI